MLIHASEAWVGLEIDLSDFAAFNSTKRTPYTINAWPSRHGVGRIGIDDRCVTRIDRVGYESHRAITQTGHYAAVCILLAGNTTVPASAAVLLSAKQDGLLGPSTVLKQVRWA